MEETEVSSFQPQKRGQEVVDSHGKITFIILICRVVDLRLMVFSAVCIVLTTASPIADFDLKATQVLSTPPARSAVLCSIEPDGASWSL